MAVFSTPEPSEPPMTATKNRSSAMPNDARAADRCGPDRSTSRMTRRTGAPVSSARGRGELSNATAHAAARRAASRLARPGVRSYDTTTTGMSNRRAANTAGMLAYPPTDTTTSGAHRRNSVVARRVALVILGTNARFCRVMRRWNPTTSRKSCGYGVAGSRRVSMPRWAPTYLMLVASCPAATSASATASAGRT